MLPLELRHHLQDMHVIVVYLLSYQFVPAQISTQSSGNCDSIDFSAGAVVGAELGINSICRLNLAEFSLNISCGSAGIRRAAFRILSCLRNVLESKPTCAFKLC